MAESSSSVVPGDVEWLPGPGATRLLRIHPPSPEPPALILRVASGAETRLEAGPGPHTQYELPGSLDWETAWLVWPDGTRAAIPAPHGREAQVIELRPRRFRPPGAAAADPTASATVDPAASRAAVAAASATADPPASAAADSAASASGHPAAPAGEPSSSAVPTSAAAAPLPPGFVRVPASVPVSESPAGPSWTTPPHLAAPDESESEWQERRGDVERELAQASAAIARAREGERLAREAVLTALTAARADLRAVRAARDADASAFAALSGELEAERSAHAVTRGSIGTLADALAAARAELAAAREAAEIARSAGQEARATVASARREAALARAEAASLRSALEAERAAREHAETELRGRAGLLQRVADLDRDTAGLRDQVELERRAREQAEAAAAAARRPPGRLLADLDAAAAALRAATDVDSPPETAPNDDAPVPTPGDDAPPAPAATGDDAPPAATAPGDDAPAAATTSSADVPTPSAPVLAADLGTELVLADAERRLRKALVTLAREDAGTAGALLVGLLPAQGAVFEGSLSYDVTVRGIGTFGVFVEDGSARVVRLSRKRPRGQALFHVVGDASTLAELLAGERTKLARFRRKGRVTGRRKRAREELGALPRTRLSLADAVEAGARLEPGLVYRALPFAVDPEWTRGHRFTVAQQIVELAPHSWHVTARDGLSLHVVEHATNVPADATVTMSHAAFERLLKDEPHPLGDRPQVRGDREAVAALRRWTDLARGR